MRGSSLLLSVAANAKRLYDDMAEDRVSILAQLHVVDGNPYRVLRPLLEPAAVETAQPERFSSCRIGEIDCADHVLGIAAAGYRY